MTSKASLQTASRSDERPRKSFPQIVETRLDAPDAAQSGWQRWWRVMRPRALTSLRANWSAQDRASQAAQEAGDVSTPKLDRALVTICVVVSVVAALGAFGVI